MTSYEEYKEAFEGAERDADKNRNEAQDLSKHVGMNLQPETKQRLEQLTHCADLVAADIARTALNQQSQYESQEFPEHYV
ncbi:MAG: hypothetical protein PHH54_01880 [Candidatus Nanoarchaeia archaeon]|nr:hypothetical protein [Candidatus Nanoarchaeia archaeon]